jgi:hypothetical protein
MVLIGAVIAGYVLVPPLARANAVLVNGVLFLILFGSLLNHRDVWLPYLSTVGKATSVKPAATAAPATAARPLPSRQT